MGFTITQTEFFGTLGNFGDTKKKTKTKDSSSTRDKSTVADTKQTTGKDLVKLGQLLLGGQQRLPPMAPKIVGQAQQTQPIVASTPQPNAQLMMALSRLLGN